MKHICPNISLFRNWGIHSPVSCKPLWISSQLDFYSWCSHENESQKWPKPKILKIFLSVFRNWTSHSPESHETFWVSLRLASQLAWLTRVSRQKAKLKIFGLLWKNLKKNTLQKQLKYSKIFLCLINIWLSMYNTFNQV